MSAETQLSQMSSRFNKNLPIFDQSLINYTEQTSILTNFWSILVQISIIKTK